MTVCSFSSFGTTISSSLEHEITIVSEANVINMNIICKCRKRLLLSQVKCIFALKESFFDRGKRKQNIVIRSFLNRYLILVKQK